MSLAQHTSARNFFLSSVVAVVAAVPSTSVADPDAQKILLEAVDAIGLAQSLQFTSTLDSNTPWGPSVLKQTGTNNVIMKRDIDAGNRWRARHEGKATASMPGLEATSVDFLVVDNNAKVMWLNHKDKVLIEKFYRSAKDQQVQMAGTTWISDMKSTDPFQLDLEAPESKVEAQQTIGGVLCNVLYIDQGDKKDKRRWYFGAEDHLPRKFETLRDPLDGKGDISVVKTITMTNLKLNPTIDETVFRIATPDGYTEKLIPKPPTRDPALNGRGMGDNNAPELLEPPKPASANMWPAAAFDFMDLGNKQVALDQLQNQTVVLYFFASWNPSAKDGTTALQELSQKYKDQPVKVIGFAVRERSEDRLRDFLTSVNATFPVVYLKDDKLFRQYRGTNYPHFVVINAQSNVTHTATGFRPDETIGVITEKIEASLHGEPSEAEGPSTSPSMGGDGGGMGIGGDDR